MRTRSCLLVLVLAAASAAGGAVSPPVLRIVTMRPLVVSGTHFRGAERVTVEGGGATTVLRTTRFGTFLANLGNVLADRCSVGVVAVGAGGDRATLPLRTMCAPAQAGKSGAPPTQSEKSGGAAG